LKVSDIDTVFSEENGFMANGVATVRLFRRGFYFVFVCFAKEEHEIK
jgi:hypothetical protein